MDFMLDIIFVQKKMEEGFLWIIYIHDTRRGLISRLAISDT